MLKAKGSTYSFQQIYRYFFRRIFYFGLWQWHCFVGDRVWLFGLSVDSGGEGFVVSGGVLRIVSARHRIITTRSLFVTVYTAYQVFQRVLNRVAILLLIHLLLLVKYFLQIMWTSNNLLPGILLFFSLISFLLLLGGVSVEGCVLFSLLDIWVPVGTFKERLILFGVTFARWSITIVLFDRGQLTAIFGLRASNIWSDYLLICLTTIAHPPAPTVVLIQRFLRCAAVFTLDHLLRPQRSLLPVLSTADICVIRRFIWVLANPLLKIVIIIIFFVGVFVLEAVVAGAGIHVPIMLQTATAPIAVLSVVLFQAGHAAVLIRFFVRPICVVKVVDLLLVLNTYTCPRAALLCRKELWFGRDYFLVWFWFYRLWRSLGRPISIVLIFEARLLVCGCIGRLRGHGVLIAGEVVFYMLHVAVFDHLHVHVFLIRVRQVNRVVFECLCVSFWLHIIFMFHFFIYLLY